MPDRSGNCKKLLSLLLAFCLLASLLPAVSAEGRETPFAAKIQAGTVFYADQDLKNETGTLNQDAVVLVTEEKGKADHIIYKLEGGKAQSWIRKDAANVIAATPTDLSPYIPDENLTLTPPATADAIPSEAGESPDTPSEPSTDPQEQPITEDPTTPDVIPGEVEESPDNPIDQPAAEEGDAPADPDVIPSEEGESADNPIDQPAAEEGDTPADPDVIPSEEGESADTPTDSSTDSQDQLAADVPAVSDVIPTEVEESSPDINTDQLVEEDPTGENPSVLPTDAESAEFTATPTDLDPELRQHGLGSIDEETWDELVSQETAELPDDPVEDYQPTITYNVVDGELVATAYVPYFYLKQNETVNNEIDLELPKVRDQGPYGTCWAFSAIGGMEIDLIAGGESVEINLSELFLAYFTAHNFDYPNGGMGNDNITFTVKNPDEENYLDIGGNNTLAYRILASLIGTTTEKDNPYPDWERTDQDKEPTSYALAAQLTGAYLVNPDEQEAIKDMIREHGSIGASIYMISEKDSSVPVEDNKGNILGYAGYRSGTNALYGTYDGTNHDILLVGWDDDFPASNFLSGLQPPGKGAWLVRNSWGYNGYGMNGYFWISYYDVSIKNRELTAYDAIKDQSQMDEFAYSYDRAPYPYSYISRPKNNPAVVKQQFTVRGQEKIQAIGVETGNDHINISIKVTAGLELRTKTQTNLRRGFHRIQLDQPISLNADTVVTVEVTYTAGTSFTDEVILIPYQYVGQDSLGSASGRYTFTGGQDGGGFTVNDDNYRGDPSIKVYTKSNGGIPVTGIWFNSDALPSEAKINSRYKLDAHVIPENADNQHIYWSSSNPNVADVDQEGWVTTGSTDGVAIITATTASGNYQKTCKVTIPRKEPNGLYIKGFNGASTHTINNANAGSFWFGSQLKIEVGFDPDHATQREVTWSTSNDKVLSYKALSKDGTATFVAKGNGSTTITVKHKNTETGTEISASIQIIIDLHRQVSSVSLDRTSNSIPVGGNFRLYPTVSPSDADNKNVIWSSSNANVASVDAYGNVYGQNWGTATITVTTVDGAKTATCVVTVTPRDLVEAFVFRMYKICLQRDPDAGGFSYWVDQLNSGKKTGAEAVFNFYESNEMKNRALPNDQYLARLYEGIMGRAPDAGGYSYWMEMMNAGMSRPYVISGFLTSKEFDNICRSYGINKGSYSSSEPRDKNLGITGFVSRLYTKLLGRSFDDVGLNYWCGIVLKNPVRATLLKVALDGFLHSNEFINMHLNDTQYLQVLYRAFLDREADAGGMSYWLGQMGSGMSRDKVAEGFAGSNEFKNIMARYGFTK